MIEAMFDLKFKNLNFLYQVEDAKECVTTKSLRNYIRRWLRKMQAEGPEYLQWRIKRMEDIIKIVSRTADNFNEISYYLAPASLGPAVAPSIELLGQTLAHVCDKFAQDKFGSPPGRPAVDTLF